MNGGTESAYEEKAMRRIMSPSGMRMLRSMHGLGADAALCNLVNRATGIKTIERVEAIASQLADNPKVRNRLRTAGYTLQVRNEAELAEMGRS